MFNRTEWTRCSLALVLSLMLWCSELRFATSAPRGVASKSSRSIDIYPSISLNDDGEESAVGSMLKGLFKASALAVGMGGGLYAGSIVGRFILQRLFPSSHIPLSLFSSGGNNNTSHKELEELRIESSNNRGRVDSLAGRLTSLETAALSIEDKVAAWRDAAATAFAPSSEGATPRDEELVALVRTLSDRVNLMEAEMREGASSKGALQDEARGLQERVRELAAAQAAAREVVDRLQASVATTKAEMDAIISRRDAEVMSKIKEFGEDVKRVVREEKQQRERDRERDGRKEDKGGKINASSSPSPPPPHKPPSATPRSKK